MPDKTITGDWLVHRPVEVSVNNFQGKSLSNWAVNFSVGCLHGCRFCYVPETSTRKLGRQLSALGVDDPDAEWGKYAFLRSWSEDVFLRSVREADAQPASELAEDGNRAIMFCSTTDAYQTFKHADPTERRRLNERSRMMVRRALELIRDNSTLRVRILTRSPLARQDFDLFRSFGDRLLFGMSLPTLDPKLMSVYEPFAPHPQRRLETLLAAKAAGLHVYVALAPTPPEVDEDDIRKTLGAIKPLDPVTVFHEPINIRADNIPRIQEHATSLGLVARLEVFSSGARWGAYAIESILLVDRIADELGLADRLRLWPDKKLGGAKLLNDILSPEQRSIWLRKFNDHWNRVSAWPSEPSRKENFTPQNFMKNPPRLSEPSTIDMTPVLKAAQVGHTVSSISEMLGIPAEKIVQSLTKGNSKTPTPKPKDLVDAAEAIVSLVDDGAFVPVAYPLATLNLDPRFQFRKGTSDRTVEKYTEFYRTKPKRVPPIVIWKGPTQLWVLDGFHRLEASIRAGLTEIPAIVVACPKPVAALLPVRFNEKNGVPYNDSDTERALFALFDANDGLKKTLRENKKNKPFTVKSIAGFYNLSPAGVSRAMKKHDRLRPELQFAAETIFDPDDYSYYFRWFKLVTDQMQEPEKWPPSEIHIARLGMAFEILERLLCKTLKTKPHQLRATLKRMREEDLEWLDEQIIRAEDARRTD